MLETAATRGARHGRALAIAHGAMAKLVGVGRVKHASVPCSAERLGVGVGRGSRRLRSGCGSFVPGDCSYPGIWPDALPAVYDAGSSQDGEDALTR